MTMHKLKTKIKRLLYFLIFYSGSVHICLLLLKIARREFPAIILFYHSFGKCGDSLHKTQMSINEFEREIMFLKKQCAIIPMDQLADNIRNKKNFNSPSIVITIDDGYQDNYELAYVVLKKYDVPGIIYLTTDLINTEKKLWLDEIEFVLHNSRVKEFSLPSLFGNMTIEISGKSEKKEKIEQICQAMKKVSNSKKIEIISELYEAVGMAKDIGLENERPMLNWEEIKEMYNSGISFGAHTRTHPILTRVSLDEAKNEILNSKKLIEKRLDVEVKHFSYPNGKETDFNIDIEKICRNSNFESAVTTLYGVNNKNSNLYALRRVSFSSPIYYFAVEILRLFLLSR